MGNRFNNFSVLELNVLRKQAITILGRLSQEDRKICEQLLSEVEVAMQDQESVHETDE